MKNILLILTALLISTTIFAQAPDRMSYQTVIRNSSNALVTSQNVGIRISILQGSATGSAVYVERHTPSTNANGLASFEIGSGTVASGTFANINWGTGTYFIKTETDPNGGSNYTITGTSQLLSVPYALHSKTADALTGGGSGGGSNWNNSGTNIISNNSGNVGIGATPNSKLHVNGSSTDPALRVQVAGSTKLVVDNNGGTSIGGFTVPPANGLYVNGRVGIGTTNPIASLHVDGFASSNTGGNYSFYRSNPANSAPSTGSSGAGVVPISIYASDRVVASEFNALSDRRIKNVLQKSNTEEDLNTLKSIAITDYTFIDQVRRGNKVVKKVIAQELEMVYPYAVEKKTGVIPNIYQMANLENGVVAVSNNLVKGDKVKLIGENFEQLFDVLEANAASFRIESDREGEVFVFGKEVDDFRVVDYDALTTLNISATQELNLQIERLKLENAALRAENDKIKKSMAKDKASFTASLEKIEAHLGLDIMGQRTKKD